MRRRAVATRRDGNVPAAQKAGEWRRGAGPSRHLRYKTYIESIQLPEMSIFPDFRRTIARKNPGGGPFTLQLLVQSLPDFVHRIEFNRVRTAMMYNMYLIAFHSESARSRTTDDFESSRTERCAHYYKTPCLTMFDHLPYSLQEVKHGAKVNICIILAVQMGTMLLCCLDWRLVARSTSTPTPCTHCQAA